MEMNHPAAFCLKYMGIERFGLSKRAAELEKSEAYWVSKLGTLSPNGLNEELNLKLFLQSRLDYICSQLTGFL